ncbi:MAG: TetR/AcrR family transcriptional regulator [Oscillospiraceae bacterium]|nr:TetR/AcrR family transcriptional regulator [Oscillospiraceae bacterium]
MPPKAKVTEDMIIKAAVEAVRSGGEDNITARSVAGILGCSTQPVMYHFPTMEELSRAAYAEADSMHTQFLLKERAGCDPLLSIGLNYIEFAKNEPSLFRFLFQSGRYEKRDLRGLISGEELKPVIYAVEKDLGTDGASAEDVFLTLAVAVHGFASLVAGGMLEYSEKTAAELLERIFTGAVNTAVKEDKNESDN